MKPFNFHSELKDFFRWGFLMLNSLAFAQEYKQPHFFSGEIISSARNTPIPVFCSDSSVFVTYKTRFKRASKSDLAFAEYRTSDLKLIRENLIVPQARSSQDGTSVVPYKKFYSPKGIFEIGSFYDSRRIEKSYFIRKTTWQSFETSPWIPIWKSKDKRYKNHFPNFRFSHDSTSLLGTSEIFKHPDSLGLQLLRVDLNNLQIDSSPIPSMLTEKGQFLEGFSEFENGKLGLIVTNRFNGATSQKEFWIFNPQNHSIRKFTIPIDAGNAEFKMIKRRNSMLIFALEFPNNRSIFHQVRRWEIHSDSELLIEKIPISLNSQQIKSVTQSFHRLSGHWIGLQRNNQRNFKIFNIILKNNEEVLVIQAFDQYEKCSQISRGIPNCNWVYSYGDVLLITIHPDSTEAKLCVFPRYREYDVPLLQGDAGFSFFQNGELKFLFGDEYSTHKKRRKTPSCVILSPQWNQNWRKELVFINKKENLFLDETTGMNTDQKHLIFGGLKNKKSTLIKINLE